MTRITALLAALLLTSAACGESKTERAHRIGAELAARYGPAFNAGKPVVFEEPDLAACTPLDPITEQFVRDFINERILGPHGLSWEQLEADARRYSRALHDAGLCDEVASSD